MKYILYSVIAALLAPIVASAQSDPHYTLFMYNKLIYNPGYAGSRDVTSINAVYRNQWSGIDGAPKTLNISIDGPIGKYRGQVRKVALGLCINNEQVGVEQSNNIMTYYAYRIKLKSSVLSFGLEAGGKLYSANYSRLNLYQSNDPNFKADIKNTFLPNFGAGIYWSGEKFYVGGSVPNMLQNYYDKNETTLNNQRSRQIRGYYLSGGYVFPVNETFKLEPQVLARYAGNATYQLPLNCDFNLSLIIYDRILLGATYRTDQSFEAILHMQVTKYINVGYAYDYATSGLNGYTNGTHEIVVGFDFARDHFKYTTPRFIRTF